MPIPLSMTPLLLSSNRARFRGILALVAGLAVLALSTAFAVVAAPGRSSAAATTATVPVPAKTSANLFAADKGSFDGSTGGWVSYSAGVTLAKASTPTRAGGGSLKLTNTTASAVTEWVASGNGPTSWTAAMGNDRYVGTAFVRAGTTSRPIGGMLVFYDSRGTALASAAGGAANDTSASWVAIPPVVALRPASTAYVTLAVIVYNAAPGEVHYIDSA